MTQDLAAIPPRVTILTALNYNETFARRTNHYGNLRRPFDAYVLQFKMLSLLLRSLLIVRTRLPIHTLVTARYAEYESQLEAFGTTILPMADVPIPAWASREHFGTFAKLSALSMVQFDKVILLDSDSQVLRNIDHLAFVPAPAVIFKAPDAWQPEGGITSATMILHPTRRSASELFKLLETMTEAEQGDGGDQAVWTYYFRHMKHQALWELPRTYSFRNGEIPDHERCLAHIIHTAPHKEAGFANPGIARKVYVNMGC